MNAQAGGSVSAASWKQGFVFALIHVVLCLVVIKVPFWILGAALPGEHGLERLVEEGGAFTEIAGQVFVGVVLWLAVAGCLRIFVWRGLPGALATVPAFLPLLAGIFGTIRAGTIALGALANADPGSLPHLFAVGSAEAFIPTMVGALQTGIALACCLSMLAMVQLAERGAEAPTAERPAKGGISPVVVAGIIAIGASIAVSIGFAGTVSLFDWTVWGVQAQGAALFALCTWKLRSFAAEDQEKRPRWAEATQLMVFSLAVAVAAVSLAGYEFARHEALASVAAFQADPASRFTALAELGSRQNRWLYTGATNVVLALLVFIPAWFANKIRRMTFRRRLSLAASALFLLASAFGVYFLWTNQAETRGRIEKVFSRFEDVAGLVLPTSTVQRFDLPSGPGIYVTADGKLLFDPHDGWLPPKPLPEHWLDQVNALRPSTHGGPPPQLLLAADHTLKFAALLKTLDPVLAKGATEFRLVVKPDKRIDVGKAATLLPIRGFDLSGLALAIETRLPPFFDKREEKPEVMGVLVDAAVARLFFLPHAGAVLTVPLGADQESLAKRTSLFQELNKTFDGIRALDVAPRPEDGLDRILEILDALNPPDGKNGPCRDQCMVTLVGDRAALEDIARKAEAPEPFAGLGEFPFAVGKIHWNSREEALANPGPGGEGTRSGRPEVAKHKGGLRAAPAGNIGKITITGTCERSSVSRILNQHSNEARYCYEAELNKEPNLRGKIVASFTIDPTGRVSDASIAESTMRNNNIEQCILVRVRRWMFPQPKDGGTCVVNSPWVFRTAEGSDGD